MSAAGASAPAAAAAKKESNKPDGIYIKRKRKLLIDLCYIVFRFGF
jgi:hypothetical protein